VLQRAAKVVDAEMFRTFNMGLDYLVIVPAGAAADALRALESAGGGMFAVDEIVEGERGVEID
jgi:phosphoribosylformylglycinamidine cyclo-ligase